MGIADSDHALFFTVLLWRGSPKEIGVSIPTFDANTVLRARGLGFASAKPEDQQAFRQASDDFTRVSASLLSEAQRLAKERRRFLAGTKGCTLASILFSFVLALLGASHGILLSNPPTKEELASISTRH